MNQLLINALNLISAEVHQNAVDHGFHNFNEDDGQFIIRALLLMNTETAELFEAWRNGVLADTCDKFKTAGESLSNEEEEIADLVIRALDYCGRRKIDIGRAVALKHAYNQKRAYRHGNKAA